MVHRKRRGNRARYGKNPEVLVADPSHGVHSEAARSDPRRCDRISRFHVGELNASSSSVPESGSGKRRLGRRDFATAKGQADEFRKGAMVSKNPAQAKQAHELDGIVALAEKDYDRALAELQQANQQNPQNLYRLCQAFQGKGAAEKAKEFCSRAANFNSLPQINYAFVRTRARAGAGTQKKA
jgi:tetratricopeptide (TPR) repeat protein